MTLSEFYALEVQCNEIMYFCNKVNEIKDAVEKLQDNWEEMLHNMEIALVPHDFEFTADMKEDMQIASMILGELSSKIAPIYLPIYNALRSDEANKLRKEHRYDVEKMCREIALRDYLRPWLHYPKDEEIPPYDVEISFWKEDDDPYDGYPESKSWEEYTRNEIVSGRSVV